MAERFKACSVSGCNGNAHSVAKGSRGWCEKHYARWRRTGTLEDSRLQSLRDEWIREHTSWTGEDCQIWPFSRIPNGYGITTFDGRREYAHRAMCEAVHGKAATPAHEAAHACGNGNLGCVHPKHLRWATPLENASDRYQHGTIQFGESNPISKLDEDKVRAIREMLKTSPVKDVARAFDVTPSNIVHIKKRRTWGWVA